MKYKKDGRKDGGGGNERQIEGKDGSGRKTGTRASAGNPTGCF